MQKERQYVTAVGISNGIITLIENNGNLNNYRQRGIDTLSKSDIANEISCGRLNKNWGAYPELPFNYSISFEDVAIMGRAVATYPKVLKDRRDNRSRCCRV